MAALKYTLFQYGKCSPEGIRIFKEHGKCQNLYLLCFPSERHYLRSQNERKFLILRTKNGRKSECKNLRLFYDSFWIRGICSGNIINLTLHKLRFLQNMQR